MSTTWIYVLGPVLGAIIAVGFEWILKGKTTAAGTLAAQGDFGSDETIQNSDERTLNIGSRRVAALEWLQKQ